MINLINLTSNLQLDAVDGLLLKKVKLEIKNIFLCAHQKYFVREIGALVKPWLRLVHNLKSYWRGAELQSDNAHQCIAGDFGSLLDVKQG